MIGYIFIVLAVFFNACCDAFENENYFESTFKHWNQKFWYKRESWKYARKIFGYKLDAWHIAKTLWIVCFGMAVAASVIWPYRGSWYVIIINVGVIWNLSFWFFYHILFKIK